jgi:hypothetical protein
MAEFNYEKDIRISEGDLDIEWLEQAELAIKYGRIWANAQKKLTLAEENIKVIRAELIAEANESPKKYCKKEKPNAADIEAYYRTHPDHVQAKKEWVEAQYECNMAAVAKNEFSFTRKAALENLVQLHGQNYFAGPKIPRNLSNEREEKAAKQRKVMSSINSTLTRSKH